MRERILYLDLIFVVIEDEHETVAKLCYRLFENDLSNSLRPLKLQLYLSLSLDDIKSDLNYNEN